ncbi:hypothetical protein AVEN_189595-1 [Araneus ventricosus]|uniref:Uncharacterized protein n=1 Tax=Araneus ventricosus TaxID=182803 RepID=A0A4Y2TXF4_ARAVE|nr:hypothetical protein AVEN_189595-1 [Araneus ventricosus]
MANAPALLSLNTKVQLEEWIHRWEKFLRHACKSCDSGRAPFPRVPWWDRELETRRKKTRALRARFMRCHHPSERLLRRQIYKRELARYKYLMKQKSRQCLLCGACSN